MCNIHVHILLAEPSKREFQILVALDDSSSMADNKSRAMALQSLATISSALSLLEAGQLGVLRFGQAAEVVHGLGQQWSQAAGRRVGGQFTFNQQETSLVSLLSLASGLFAQHRGQAAHGLAVSQRLVILSDGRLAPDPHVESGPRPVPRPVPLQLHYRGSSLFTDPDLSAAR